MAHVREGLAVGEAGHSNRAKKKQWEEQKEGMGCGKGHMSAEQSNTSLGIAQEGAPSAIQAQLPPHSAAMLKSSTLVFGSER